MGKALVIAEKPSVAGDLARALGGFKKAGPPALAAIHDSAGNPRGIRAFAQRRGDAPAGKRGAVALGKRLARGHQLDARSDFVQFQTGGRVSKNDGGPRADTDAGDPR